MLRACEREIHKVKLSFVELENGGRRGLVMLRNIEKLQATRVSLSCDIFQFRLRQIHTSILSRRQMQLSHLFFCFN
jgi:hypothetical protein